MFRPISIQIPVLALTATLVSMPVAPARADTLIRVDRYNLDELGSTGFELPRKARVEIEAVGLRPRRARDYSAYAWILDTKTREVVWSQQDARSERKGDDRDLRRTKHEIDLEPGRYELYTWAGSASTIRGSRIYIADSDDWHDIVRGRWDDGWSDHDLRRATRDCYVELRSNDLSKNDVKTFEPTGEIPGAIYRATRLGDGTYKQVALTLDRPMNLRIYALVEYPRDFDGVADGGWIVDTVTRDRVWDIARRDTRRGGGAEKNRVFDDEVHLDAGKYVLYWGTDDSHSWDGWNANPPDDPMNWGVTLLPGKNFERAGFHLDEHYSRGEPLLALTRARDNDWLEQPFSLAREANLQVYALGEWDRDRREFADRAWITKAASSDVVWEMEDRNTEAAGGAEKNRMSDGTIKLPAGEYVAHYETDDSHSYHDWNSAAPFDEQAWGLSLYAGPGFVTKDFKLLEQTSQQSSANTLVQIVGVGDHARKEREFEIDRPTRVRIYAIGEGVDGMMYDYGWIENKRTGQVVWEMTYRSTRPAGGAHKNRLFDGTILLDAGSYEVHYETDDSHSFPDWNARRPRDPHSWGITLSIAKAEKED
jgi:hypothetical protein